MNRVLPGVWAGAVIALSTVPLAAGYVAWWALPVLIGCVVLPIALVAIGRWARLGAAWIALGVGILGTVGAVSLADRGIAGDPAWWRSSPGLEYLGPLIDAVPRLLTAPRPAPPEVGYLVPAALLTWLVALGVGLAVGGRSRVAPLVGALVLQGAGALVTTGQGDPHGAVAAASIAVLLLGWIGLREEAPRRRDRGRGAWPVSAAAALVVGALALTGAGLAHGDRFEPRTLVPPPRLPAEATNPLPNVSLWNSRADDVLFRLTPIESAAPERIRLAVLPDFDGAAWTLDGRLRQVGVVDTPDLEPGEWQRSLTYRIERVELDGAWVPSLGRASAVEPGGVLMDVDTGSLVAVTAGRVAAGGGEPVRVTTTVDDAADEAIARAGVPPEHEVERYLRLPRLPAELAQQAADLTAADPGPWDQVSALAEFVRGERILDEGAPSGSSYGRIGEFLYGEEGEGGQVGTTEQFASALAVLARAAGIPSRLVVGFDLSESETSGGTVAVTGGDARVWTEVYFARAGWVSVDASPDSSIRTDHTPPDAGSADGAAPEEPEEAESAAPQPEESAPPEQPASTPAEWSSWIAVAGAVLAGVLLLGLVGLAGLRLRRRLVHRGGGAMGAWAHVLDAARLAGTPVPPRSTPEALAARFAGLDSLAERAQAEAYAPAVGLAAAGETWPVEPSGDQSGRSAGGREWAAAVAAERAMRRSSPWWRRLLWHITPLRRH